MSDKNLKQRDQIPQEYKWNIEDMYPDESLWEQDVDECIKRAENFKDRIAANSAFGIEGKRFHMAETRTRFCICGHEKR